MYQASFLQSECRQQALERHVRCPVANVRYTGYSRVQMNLSFEFDSNLYLDLQGHYDSDYLLH